MSNLEKIRIMSVKKFLVGISFIFLVFTGVTSCTTPEVVENDENIENEQSYFTGKDELEER